MNPDSQEFEQLRRLFAIKRHEQPPPGYFNHFSRDVLARIKAGETGESYQASGWIQKFWALLEAKPIFAGAFGASVCAVLISGILNSEEAGALGGVSANGTPANSPFVPVSAIAQNQSVTAGPVLNSAPVDPSLNSLFDFHLSAQPVSLTVPGN